MSTIIIVAPTGVPAKIEIIIPKSEQTTANPAEHIVTALKLLNTRIADNAGKIIKADTNSEPTKFIATTITTAIIVAINTLYNSTLVPEACAKFSSNVTANILL